VSLFVVETHSKDDYFKSYTVMNIGFTIQYGRLYFQTRGYIWELFHVVCTVTLRDTFCITDVNKFCIFFYLYLTFEPGVPWWWSHTSGFFNSLI